MSVLLIGLAIVNETLEGRLRKNIKLYATDLTIATDIEMTLVIGTEDGRIFMCGQQDGNLYEMHYQANESWFGKRVQLINHSVGGVQSLLPRFASSTNDGNCIHPFTALHADNISRTHHCDCIRHQAQLFLHSQLAEYDIYV